MVTRYLLDPGVCPEENNHIYLCAKRVQWSEIIDYVITKLFCSVAPTFPPSGQQKGQLVDGRLALQRVRLPRLQLHHLVLEGARDLLEHLDGNAQRQVDGLVQGGHLLAAYSLPVQPEQQVADLSQAGQQQQQVPAEDVHAAHGHPAPQGQAGEGGAQEAEDEEAPEGPAAAHVAQDE